MGFLNPRSEVRILSTPPIRDPFNLESIGLSFRRARLALGRPRDTRGSALALCGNMYHQGAVYFVIPVVMPVLLWLLSNPSIWRLCSKQPVDIMAHASA